MNIHKNQILCQFCRDLGTELEKFRIEKGLSKKEAASLAGLNEARLLKWIEQGNPFVLYRLPELIDAYHLRVKLEARDD
mgnify:FL=1